MDLYVYFYCACQKATSTFKIITSLDSPGKLVRGVTPAFCFVGAVANASNGCLQFVLDRRV